MKQLDIFRKLFISLLALFLSIWTSGAAAQESFKDCDDCPEMILVPAGTVTLGIDPSEAFRLKWERTKQLAQIKEPFAMAAKEVTLKQYRQFMQESGHQPVIPLRKGEPLVGCNYYDGKSYGYIRRHSWENSGFPQREDSPVVCVSWSDADQFAQWLSEKTGREYRVPSAVEFEYAMRAGSAAAWPWGSDPDKACEYANIADITFSAKYPKRDRFACDDGYTYLASVGKFKPNAFGLYDMLGNAWEWTSDCWHDDLSKAPLDGTSWQEADGGDCDARTPKGGGWISGPGWARSSVRSKDGAHYRSFMLGFRVAASIGKRAAARVD